MRKRLIVAITFLAGIYFIIEFLLPEYFPSGYGPSGAYRGWKIGEYQEEIFTGLQAVGTAAIGLGLINIFRVFGVTVLKRRKGWPYSLTLLCSMLAMMVVMFWDWGEDLHEQHLVGPLGTQRKFQGLILDRVAGPMGAARPAKETALGRYIDDTRASVAPPEISVEEAAEHLDSMAQLLKGTAPPPGFFNLTDGAPSPLLSEKTDLLAAPPSDAREPLQSADAAKKLADLTAQRDALANEVKAAGEKIKALAPTSPAGSDIAKALNDQAHACRLLAPRLRDLAREVSELAARERDAYRRPDDLDRKYKGGTEPPPPPPFGRYYVASRVMKHSAHVMERFATVLGFAALSIPKTEQDQRALVVWLDERQADAEKLRQRWRGLTEADLRKALPAARIALEKKGLATDPLRTRVLDDLDATIGFVSLYDRALGKLAEARGGGPSDRNVSPKSAAEAIAGAANLLTEKAPSLRQHHVRRTEQSLRYLDLTEEDAGQILPASLAELAASTPDNSRAQEVFRGIADAADQQLKELEARQVELQAALDADVRALRKAWEGKTSLELHQARKEQDKRARSIEELKSRGSFVADAKKIAQSAGEQLGEAGGIKALTDLAQEVLKAADTAAAQPLVEKAFRALEDQRLTVVNDGAKALERLAYKDDLKDVLPLMDALAGAKALSAAEQSAAMVRRAALSAGLAADALKGGNLAGARTLMKEVRDELGAARMGTQEALSESGQRSVAKVARTVLFQGLYVALGAAMFSLLAFYIASAAYRAFRVKSAEAVLMMIAALLVMLGQIPFGAYISEEMPYVRLWVMQVFSTPAFRGIALGSSVAFLAMAIRMWLSLETKSFYQEEETGKEGT